jgi:hypothetical protein
MKTARTYPDFEMKLLKPQLSHCPYCETKLQYFYWVVDKFVVTLSGVLRIKSEAWGCPNPECHEHHGKVVYQSSETHRYALPKATFGLDVVAFVGFERSRQHRNFDEIYQDLQEKSVTISRRNVDYLYRQYECLIRCSLHERIELLKPRFEKNGGIILSIDGLQPQQGNDVLFVLRDVLTREVLHAELLHSTNTDAMVRLFEVIRDSGVPVKGIVSDAQHSIRKAKDLVFPQVPFQLCTYHYLKALGKPVGKQDQELREDVKKSCVVCAPLSVK